MSCEGCKYWSQLIAQTDTNGFVEAMCLNPKRAPAAFTRHRCRHYEAGDAIDMDERARAINERFRERRERRERE